VPLTKPGEAGEGEEVTLADLGEQAHAKVFVQALSRRERRTLERRLRVSKGERRGSYASARTIKRGQA